MAIYHCSIKIISRAGGRSAIASAAYRSGEKLYNDETGLTFDFTYKGGVAMNEIILPSNAPKEYQDRETLWNVVQKVEKRSDAQFAREIEVALPVELTRDEQIECVRDFVMENFVAEGMIADWALHDKGDGNPHAHIMLTMRGLDEHKGWLEKQKTVFANARDENGRPIYNPELPSYDVKNKEATAQYRIPALDESGNQKTRVRQGKGTEYLWEKISIPANDWNEHSKAEKWRESWAIHCNKYLDEDHKIDHRSYERHGLDLEPTVHEGLTARKIEKEGKVADRCQINREIRERNSVRKKLKEVAQEITNLITEKARKLLGRFEKFRGGSGYIKSSGGDGNDLGESANRSRKSSDCKSKPEGTIGRIHELKRNTELTDREIEKTDRRIAEMQELIARKEDNISERIRKLKSRRTTDTFGGDAGSDRNAAEENIISDKSGAGKLQAATADIEAFLRELNLKERADSENREDSGDEQADKKSEGEGRESSGDREDVEARTLHARRGRR